MYRVRLHLAVHIIRIIDVLYVAKESSSFLGRPFCWASLWSLSVLLSDGMLDLGLLANTWPIGLPVHLGKY